MFGNAPDGWFRRAQPNFKIQSRKPMRTHDQPQKPFIPSWLDDRGLSAAAFRVFSHLCRRADNKTGLAWPSLESIGVVCRISRKTVVRALNHLADEGLIRKQGKPFGGSTRYLVLSPNSVATGTNEASPIVSPVPINRAPSDPPIVSPGAREGYPRKGIHERVSNSPLPPKGAFEAEFSESWNQAVEKTPIPALRLGIPKRCKRNFNARTQDEEWMECWEAALKVAITDPFYSGKNERGWIADIEWFLRPNTVAKTHARTGYRAAPTGRKLSNEEGF